MIVTNFTGLEINIHPAGDPSQPVVMSARPNGADPTRLIRLLSPGHYQYEFFGDQVSANAEFDLVAGDQREIALSLGQDARTRTGPHSSDATPAMRVEVSPLAPPQGCPGAIVAAPPPSAQCPGWYTAPPAAMGLFVVENHTSSVLGLTGAGSTSGDYTISPKRADQPGRLVLNLAPGHYEWEANSGGSGGRIRLDIAAGQSLVTAVANVSRNSLGQMAASALPIPDGCTSSAPPPAPTQPPALCPRWFTRPNTGKGLLVIENHFGGTNPVVVSAVSGLTWEQTLAPKAGDEPSRAVLQLAPGRYEFVARGPSFTVNIEAEQMMVAALIYTSVFKTTVSPFSPPSGCP